MQQQVRSRLPARFCFLIGSCFSMIVNSNFYLIGNITPYIASYFNSIDNTTTISTVALVQAFWGSFLGIGCIIAPFFLKNMKQFDSFALSLSLMVFSLFAASFIKNFYIFVIVLTVLFGLCLGANIIFCFNYTWRHFPAIKGRITGTCYFFYTASPVVFNILQSYIVNPEGKEQTIIKYYDGKQYKFFDESISKNVPNMFRISAGIFLVISIISMIFMKVGEIKLKEEEKQIEKEIIKQPLISGGKSINSLNELKKFQEQEADRQIIPTFLTFNFQLLCLLYICAATQIYYVTFCYKDFGLKHYPTKDKYISFISGVAALFNGVGRFTGGFIIDRFGFKISMLFGLIPQVFVLLSIYYIDSIVVFSIVLIMSFYFSGFPFTFMPSYLMNRYTVILGGKLYPIFSSTLVIISLFTYLIQGYLTTQLDELYIFLIVTMFGLLAILIVNFLEPDSTSKNNIQSVYEEAAKDFKEHNPETEPQYIVVSQNQYNSQLKYQENAPFDYNSSKLQNENNDQQTPLLSGVKDEEYQQQQKQD